ncbi:MAG TPA: PTS system mannose/fructose/sorbose family transporter subunit IID [Candidatus Eisenbacteria bacterium]|jgi:PTS system mannose-specific IID component|nr:PTS system mannose/fructose/sorbose family transporter subunit IID [Candidatus Eisenbacteria bacterium]
MTAPAPRVRASDLLRVMARSFLLQAIWNPERQQGAGFAFALRPVLTRLFGKAGEARALARHTGYFNTHPAFASYALGAIGRLESDRAQGAEIPDEAVDRAKATLGPALAALGDSLMWSTLRPVAAALGVTWVLAGSLWGPLLFLLLYNALHLYVRVRGVMVGWRMGLGFWEVGMRRRLSRLRVGLRVGAVLGAVALADAMVRHVAAAPSPTAPGALVFGAALGLAWGEGRRLSASLLGLGLFSLALAWATLVR